MGCVRPASIGDPHPPMNPAPMSETRRGIGLAFAAALLFGVSAPIAKLLLGAAEPQLLAGLLYLGSGTGLAVVRVARGRAPTEAPLSKRDVPWLAGAIAFGGVLAPMLLMLGLARTPASSASLLLNLEGVFTALFAWFVFKENFDRRIALGMAAIVAGGALLSVQQRLNVRGIAGPLLITTATLCWAIDNNFTQKVSAGDPVVVAMLKGLAAGAINTAIATTQGAQWPGPPALAAALLVGFLSYGVSLVLFVLALRHLGTARTAAYFSSAPFIGALLSIVVFREKPGAVFLAAASLMVSGVWLHLSERHEHEHRHEATEHEHRHTHDQHHQHAHVPGDPPGEPHSHIHRHEPVTHSHPHYPDIHHRHRHD